MSRKTPFRSIHSERTLNSLEATFAFTFNKTGRLSPVGLLSGKYIALVLISVLFYFFSSLRRGDQSTAFCRVSPMNLGVSRKDHSCKASRIRDGDVVPPPPPPVHIGHDGCDDGCIPTLRNAFIGGSPTLKCI